MANATMPGDSDTRLKSGFAGPDNLSVVGEHERRVGQRYPTTISLRWRVQGRRIWRARRATIVDVSVTGARISAPTDEVIVIGKLMDINIRGARGVVEVRRVEVSPNPTLAYYGVQFVQLDRQLKDLVLQLTRGERTYPTGVPASPVIHPGRHPTAADQRQLRRPR